MTPTALKTLKGSIKKWKAIAAGTGRDDGDRNCPLCIEYFEFGCNGCPVSEATDRSTCGGTPYRTSWERGGYPKIAETDEQKAAAKEMLDFLKGLLPPKSAKLP